MDLTVADSVRPKAGHPFLIVTPPYARISAGVTVLHIFCHYLNLLGENAYIAHYPPEQDGRGFLPSYARLQKTGEFPEGLNAPLVTQELIDFFRAERLLPIVVYPEVFDNPFNASFFCRYLLNYPGLLAPAYEQKADFTFAYSRIVADSVGVEETLYVPTADLSFWNKRGAWRDRAGSCFYAGKLRQIHGAVPAQVPSGSIEVPRGKEMSREEIRDLFWRCETFYCFEDTSLATEAMICGCPTVFVPNEFFNGRPLAVTELGSEGSCIFGEDGGLERARAGVDQFETRVRATFPLVPERVKELAAEMKRLARAKPYEDTFTYPFEPRMVFFDKVAAVELGLRDGQPMPAAPATTAGPEPAPSSDSERKTLEANYARATRDFLVQRDLAESATAEITRLSEELAALRSSTSWRMTAPLRRAVMALRPGSKK